MKKLFSKGSSNSFRLNDDDEQYKVSYLGNVCALAVKGEGCADKALEQLWRHYLKLKKGKPMRLSLTTSTLRIKHGNDNVVDYNLNKIIYVIAPTTYPKVFAWIYKHSLKSLKVEFRCHAVMCEKVDHANQLSSVVESRIKLSTEQFMRMKKRDERSRKTKEKLLNHNHLVPLSHYASSNATLGNGTNTTGHESPDMDSRWPSDLVSVSSTSTKSKQRAEAKSNSLNGVLSLETIDESRDEIEEEEEESDEEFSVNEDIEIVCDDQVSSTSAGSDSHSIATASQESSSYNGEEYPIY